MASHGDVRLVEDLRNFLDDLAFRAKRLGTPLLRPFGPSAEPAAVDDVGLDWLQAKLRSICTTLWAAEDRVVADNFVTLRDLEHATKDVLEELAARLEEFKAQLLQSSDAGEA
jgi:hypothetical protein